jgi:hypothetical protein
MLSTTLRRLPFARNLLREAARYSRNLEEEIYEMKIQIILA